MGLYISLNLTPTIASEQWDRFWCESLQLLKNFPLRFVRPAKHNTSYGFQKIWTDKLIANDENGEYWEVAGDAESLVFGESVRLYRNIEYYRNQWRRLVTEKRPTNDDPLFCTSQDYAKSEYDDVPLAGLQLFRSGTQGYPYHHAIVAVVTLAEHRFPLHSLAWDDLRPQECNTVREWLSSLHHEDVLLPVCFDAARLWNRIEGACADIPTTMKRFEERFLGSPVQRIHRMLAESKTATMEKLADDFLQYDQVTLGFRDLSKSFLEATNDLELYLDLIGIRNSMAQSKESQEKKHAVIKLEDVLKMLVKGFVSYSQWQGEEIRTLRHWLELEGNVVQTINATILKMGMPVFFDYYCPENDLLDAFIRREPAKRDLFHQVLQDTLAKNSTAVDLIKDFVHSIEVQAESEASDDTENDDSEGRFTRLMRTEASVQSGLPTPLTEESVALLGRFFGYHVGEMQRVMTGTEEVKFLNDPTGKNQRTALLAIIHQNDGRLLEEAILEIERTDDVELLKLFVAVAPSLFNDVFRREAPQLFGKGFEKIYPALWHLINKPIWWKTFCEHRNDGYTEGQPET